MKTMKQVPVSSAPLVTESVHGTYYYHLAPAVPGRDGRTTSATRALCGARVMSTAIPLVAWGYRGHLGERYCSTCATHEEGARALATSQAPA